MARKRRSRAKPKGAPQKGKSKMKRKSRSKQQRLTDASVVFARQGQGRLNKGSARFKLMAALKAAGRKGARLLLLRKRLRRNPKPIIAKLMEKGWVALTPIRVRAAS